MATFEHQDLGYELGSEAVDQIVMHAEQYCEFEKQRIEAVNQPELVACRAELMLLQETEQALVNELPAVKQPSGASLRRRRGFNLAMALVLSISSLAFLSFTFERFRLGWKSWVCITGIAAGVPFALDYFLHYWRSERLLRVLAAALLVVSIPSAVLLAELRGELLTREITTSVSPVTFGDDTLASQPVDDFGHRAATLLGLAMIFISLGLEIGAGLALHEFNLCSDRRDERGENIRVELTNVRAKMIPLLFRISQLQAEPRIMYASFWRDFYRALLTRAARSAVSKLSMVCLLAIVISRAHAQPVSRHQIVAVIDLSQTEAVRDYSGRSELQENIDALARVAATIPADSELSVLGITDGAGPPDMLLSARISADEGYFGERLATARKAVLARWRRCAAELRASFPHTDLFGALAVASELLAHSRAADKLLFIFSDMRHETKGFNLEGPHAINVSRMMSLVRERSLSVPLSNVTVYVMGAHAAGRELAYWSSLRDFWVQYFRASGAMLGAFSMTRDIRALPSTITDDRGSHEP